MYQVSEFYGDVMDVDENLSPFVSTRGGVTLYLVDTSRDDDRIHGKGFLANVSISGNGP